MLLTLTNISKPHILQSTTPQTMHPLDLIRSDNHIGETGSIVENKDRIGASCIIGVAWTGDTAVEFLVAVVFGAGDCDGGGEGLDAAGTGGD